MIVKVQIPLAAYGDAEPLALIYDRNRSFESYAPISQELINVMGGSLKKFFRAVLGLDGRIELKGEVSDPGW